MIASTQETGPELSDELSREERKAVNAFCARYFAEWEADERSWEYVDFLRALNAGAAMTVVKMRAEKGLG